MSRRKEKQKKEVKEVDLKMEKKGVKNVVIVFALCSILSFSIGYALQNNIFSKHQPMGSFANVFFTIESPMGIYDLQTSNLITDIGEEEVAERMRINDTYTAVEWISLSNDASPDESWTELPTEETLYGSARALGTVSAQWLYGGVDSAYNVTKKFTFTDDITLQCAGGNWASSGDNNLYSAAAFTQTAFANNWNLTITWVYVFNGN
jgi:hypothetical protein